MFSNHIDNELQIGDLTLTRKLFISVKGHSAFLIASQQNKKIILTLDDSLDTTIRGLFYTKKPTKFADLAKLLADQDCVEAKEIAKLITSELRQENIKSERGCCRVS